MSLREHLFKISLFYKAYERISAYFQLCYSSFLKYESLMAIYGCADEKVNFESLFQMHLFFNK